MPDEYDSPCGPHRSAAPTRRASVRRWKSVNLGLLSDRFTERPTYWAGSVRQEGKNALAGLATRS